MLDGRTNNESDSCGDYNGVGEAVCPACIRFNADKIVYRSDLFLKCPSDYPPENL